MNFDEYRALTGYNWSSIKHLRVSPKHFQHATQQPPSDAPHFRIGRAMHTLVLEPDLFESTYARCDMDRRTKAYKEWAAGETRTILSADEYDRALGAGMAILVHPVASSYLSRGLRESVIQWTDPETGLPLKGRVDFAGRVLVDIKSTSNLDERLFASTVIRLGYLEQLQFYSMGLAANDIVVDPSPVLIAVESSPPHDVVTYRVPEDAAEYGRKEVRRLLELLKRCLDEDRWPGRCEAEQDFMMPAWAVQDDGLELVMPDGEAISV